MAKRFALGKGLDALIPEDDSLLRMTDVPLSEIDVNADQPRRAFDDESLRQLAESVAQVGVLQPLLVVARGGRYRIVAGERRYRAARLAGLAAVPCIVRDFDEAGEMEAALIENMQREDLNPIDEALGVRALMDACGYTQEQAASRLGRSRPAVANLLRLLLLPDSVRELVSMGKLSAGHARALAGLQSEERQIVLARRAVSEGLSVRALERLCAEQDLPDTPPRPRETSMSLELQDMEGRLRMAFGVRAKVSGNDAFGKIVLPYATPEELERINEALGRLL